MLNIYVDEVVAKDGEFRLGCLAFPKHEPLREMQANFHSFWTRERLKFHCQEDLKGNGASALVLKEHIMLEIRKGLQNGHLIPRAFDGSSEHDAWRNLLNWVRRTLHPSYEQPVNILHDTYSFSKKAGGAHKLISGLDSNVIRMQSVRKIQRSESNPERHAYIIGAVDYMLYFNEFDTLKYL